MSVQRRSEYGVEISIESGVTAADGSTYGDSTYLLSFTTDRYPKVAGPHVIEREIRAATDELSREYVAGLLLKNTVELLNRYALDKDTPGFVAHKFVVNKTVIDILDDNTWRIYYSTRTKDVISLPYCIDVEAGNPCNILKVHDKPLFMPGKTGTFDETGITMTSIVNVGNDKYIYYIY